VHRLFHSIPALWRIHQIHHSIEEMDWLAGARVHPIDQILTRGATLLPCFALGFSAWTIAVFAVAYHWHSMLLHSNLRLSFGPLNRLIASPDFHRWHHCRDREAWDRNFAGQLSLMGFCLRDGLSAEGSPGRAVRHRRGPAGNLSGAIAASVQTRAQAAG
jgi:sterol desaturase/sphingolipid hydroxylase (fatty acid hydroxylase superfamily)